MMTLPSGSDRDDDIHDDDTSADARGEAGAGRAGAGRSVEPTHGDAADPATLAPFLAAAKEGTEPPVSPRTLFNRVLDYSAHAAMIAGLLGFAWTVSDHVAKVTPPPAPPKPAAATAEDAAALRRDAATMTADLTRLRASLEALRATIHADKTADQVRSLTASLETVKSGLNATKAETNAALTQLAGKVDRLPHDTNAKVQQVADRLERLETLGTDRTVTGSLPPPKPAVAAAVAAAPAPAKPVAPPPKPAAAAEPQGAATKTIAAVEPDKKPAVLAGWVVRDVYDGVALIESKRGPLEVVRGTSVPGAGVVRSIERHGAAWTVTTTKGQIAYLAPPRAHAARGYYRNAPDDF